MAAAQSGLNHWPSCDYVVVVVVLVVVVKAALALNQDGDLVAQLVVIVEAVAGADGSSDSE